MRLAVRLDRTGPCDNARWGMLAGVVCKVGWCLGVRRWWSRLSEGLQQPGASFLTGPGRTDPRKGLPHHLLPQSVESLSVKSIGLLWVDVSSARQHVQSLFLLCQTMQLVVARPSTSMPIIKLKQLTSLVSYVYSTGSGVQRGSLKRRCHPEHN